MLLLLLWWIVGAFLLPVVVLWIYQSYRIRYCPPIVAWFHPHCGGGGGGERVLWKMVPSIAATRNAQVYLFSIDSLQTISKRVPERFNIDLPPFHIVPMADQAHLLRPAPRLSLIVESLAGLYFVIIAFCRMPQLPSVYIDTTGNAFTFVWFKLIGCRILTYVHYPTISTDMLQLVQSRTVQYNNTGQLSQLKYLYYLAFAVLYGSVGSLADVVLLNSTWTHNHIRGLWKLAAWRKRLRIVYPPCSISVPKSRRQLYKILSIGQFRPEKNHALQLASLRRLLERFPQYATKVRLVILGSCRNAEDTARLAQLQNDAADLPVDFFVNQPYAVLQEQLATCSIGLHTMWNEHFGIGIVEMMAAGLVVVAHRSGGPRSDIVQRPFGRLAVTADEYAECYHEFWTCSERVREQMRSAARESAERFSDAQFVRGVEAGRKELMGQ